MKLNHILAYIMKYLCKELLKDRIGVILTDAMSRKKLERVSWTTLNDVNLEESPNVSKRR